MDREELLSKVRKLYVQYNYAADLIDVYHNSDAAEDEMKKAGRSSATYFRLVCSACADAFLMTLARLYDVNKDSENIPALINECKNNKTLFNHPDQVMCYLTDAGREQKRNNELSETIATITARRNAFLAHNDRKHFSSRSSSDNGKEDKATRYMGMYHVWELSRYTGELLSFLLSELSCDPSEIGRQYHNEIGDLLPGISLDFKAPV